MKRKWAVISFVIFVLGAMIAGGLWESSRARNPTGEDVTKHSYVKEVFDQAAKNLENMGPQEATIWMGCHIIEEVKGLKKSTVVYAVWGIFGAFIWNFLFGPYATGVLRGKIKP